MYVDIKSLSFRYKNSREAAVQDFNFSIEQGEIISILGESGSGKSTVLRLIAGLEVPTSGLIKIDNRTVVDRNTFLPPEKRGVGMVFQDYALFPHMTVAKNIKFGLKKLTKAEKDDRLKQVLNLTGLEEYAHRYPYELSGGQQQRVALARALAPKPALLLLDEPFSNLDANLQTKIRKQLKKILKQAKTTCVFVTHDKEDAQVIADRVIVLNEGRIVKTGDPQHVL